MPIEVTDRTFDEKVVERSHTIPVIVVFWVPASRAFGADGRELEDTIAHAKGSIELVRAKGRRNQDALRRYEVEGIPACLGFHQGRLISSFAGQLSPQQHLRYLCDTMAAIGEEAWYRRAVGILFDHKAAAIPLVRILLGRGDGAEALDILEKLQQDDETMALTAEARRLVLPDRESYDIEGRLEILLPEARTDDGARAEFIELLNLLDVGSPDRAAHWRKHLSSLLH